jgi:ribosome-dependent ATPase
MSVMVATAYMDEAERFDWLVAMDAGRCWPPARPPNCTQQTGTATLEAAFIALLPEEKKTRPCCAIVVPPLA